MVSQVTIPARAARARLRRRTEHRLLAGVAGGIADWLNAPVAFIRFFIGLAALWSPWLVAAYAVAALLLPARDRSRPDWDNLVGAGRLGLVFAGPWLALPSGVVINEGIGGSPGWAIASYAPLGAAAAVMLSADYRRGRPRTREEARATVLACLPVAACALLLVAGMELLPDVRWEHLVPMGAIAGAVALLVGRRRELVAPALIALAAAVVVVASGARLEGGVGDMTLQPADPRGEPIVARRAAGDVELDLRLVRDSAAPVHVEASVGLGNLRVTVPRWAHVYVDARVGRGDIYTLLRGRWGEGFDRRVAGFSPGRPGGVRIRVLAEVGSGSVDINRFGG
jgi:phage shock protein PspC (stress-responsive transcriptional regulator)